VIRVLIASRAAAPLRALQQCLAGRSKYEVHARLISNGHTDPLHGVPFDPDLVVLRFDAEHLAELAAWNASHAAARPPLIVVGPAANAEAMRLAIRAGAKDFLAEPVAAADLVAVLDRVHAEFAETTRRSSATPAGALHAFVGAGGGAGTSFLATNVARMLALKTGRPGDWPVLIDMDLNFSPLLHYLDLHPERGLLQALDVVTGLDEHALSGFLTSHRSGLRLLSNVHGPAVLSKDVSSEKLARLLELLVGHHDHVLVDAPHALDTLTATVFGIATHVVLVVQQSVLQVRNAVRLQQILRDELGVPTDRMRVVVNRYHKDALVQLDDVQRSLGEVEILTVPSHYRSALESTDTGVPLYDVDRDSTLVRALQKVAHTLAGTDDKPRSGLLSRVLPGIFRSSK
jgi:pilus assembly protein CpaE